MESTRKQVPISGEPTKYEGEGKKRETLASPGKTVSHPEKSESYKTEEEHRIITKTLRPLGVTSIRSVDVVNRHYLPHGSHMYIKSRDGVYQNTDVSGFLNNADIRIVFTLPIDVDPNELAFTHQKSACPVVNPLLRCQCSVRVGLIESVGASQKVHELVQGRAGKTYVIELPLIRGLHLEPFQTLHYSIRMAGLKMPEQTDLYWRIHLKVCQADDLIEVVSVSDTAFDVTMLQDNIHTFSDRINDMVVTPIKRRGWLGWFKKSKQEQRSTSSDPHMSEQPHPGMSESTKPEETASLRA